jgi:hypothetical protein
VPAPSTWHWSRCITGRSAVADLPLLIRMWDRDFGFLGMLDDVAELDLSIFHNERAAGTFTTSNRSAALAKLTDGSRLTVDYEGAQIASGLVDAREGEALSPGGQVAFTLAGDFDMVKRTLGWPNPAQASTEGVVFTMSPAYDVVQGPAETVVKMLIGANVRDRLGRPVTVAPDQGRGDTIKVQLRNHPLTDKLLPKVTNAGIGISVVQDGAGYLVDCYTPGTYPVTLTPKSGIVTSAQFSIVAPTTTRTIAGGQGDGTARKFVTYIADEVESNWGIVREDAVDARDVDNDADLIVRGQEAQAEGRRKTSFTITLQETATFRYGTHLHLGDTVNESLLPDGQTRTHTVTEVRFTFKDGSGDDAGFRVTPVVGDITDSPARRVAMAIERQAARLRDLGMRD